MEKRKSKRAKNNGNNKERRRENQTRRLGNKGVDRRK